MAFRRPTTYSLRSTKMKQFREQQGSFTGLLYGSITTLVIVAVCPGRLEAQDHDETLKERFLREAPARWDEYQRHAEKLQGNYTGRFAATINKVSHRSLVEYKANREGRLLKQTTEVDSGGKKQFVEEVHCTNPQYTFRLERKSSGSAWMLIQLELLDNRSIPENIVRRFAQHTNAMADPVRVHNQTLAEMIRTPYFRVVRCRIVQNGQEELVEVGFSSSHDVGRDTQDMVQGGTLVLDPRRFWCLRSYDLQGKTAIGTGPMRFRLLEPTEPTGTLPVAKRTHTEFDWMFTSPVGNHSRNKQEWHLDIGGLREPERLPGDGEFTLSAFGLPEPAGVTKATPWYLWLALVGGLCLLLGVVFRWLKTRVATTAPTL